MAVDDPATNRARFSPVTREVHGGLRWRPPGNYMHAAQDAFIPIVRSELAHACLEMPLAFARAPEGYVLVAVLSLTPRFNAFVAPTGRWLGRYVPLMLRLHPFRLGRVENTDDFALAVDNSAVTEPGSDQVGEPFYGDDGALTESLTKFMNVLADFERSRTDTNRALAALDREGVIRPWEIKQTISGEEQLVTGLFRVDEASLVRISGDAFLRLRDAMAISLAYCQLISMGKLSIFEELTVLRDGASPPAPGDLQPAKPPSFDSAFGILDEGSLRFE